MLRNYLTIALRNLLKNKISSTINLLGLIVSFSAYILILLYIQYELSFDRFNKNAAQTYRVWTLDNMGISEGFARTPAPLAAFIKNNYPEIKNTVRIAKRDKVIVNVEGRIFCETGLIIADSSIFSVFTYPLLVGDPRHVLEKPNSVVISEYIAAKYFKNENPIGKLLKIDHKTDLVITGLLKNVPSNSHIRFDFLASIQSSDSIYWKGYLNDPVNTVVSTYIQLQPKVDLQKFLKKVDELRKNYDGLPFGDYKIQPITDIHLHSHLGGEFESNSDIKYIYIFSLVAILVLTIACINYTNLSLVLYSTRIREVGVRKVFGSGRGQLISLFSIESFIMLFLSFNFAFVIVKLILPWLNQLIGLPLELIFFNDYMLWSVFLIIPLVALLAGFYPTLYVTRFKPILIFKNQNLFNNKSRVRQSLVFIQYVFSVILVVSGITIFLQIRYVKNKDLGLSKNALVLVPISDWTLSPQLGIFKTELLQSSKIVSVTGISNIPGEINWITSISYEGQVKENENGTTMPFIRVDNDFLKSFQLNLVAGHDFSSAIVNNGEHEYILNQSAVKSLGWKDPIGKKFESPYGGKGKIVGVVSDFHFKSLHNQIEPIYITVDDKNFDYIAIKVKKDNILEAIAFAKEKWNEFAKGVPFEYYLYDNYLNKLYKQEKLLEKIILIFSFLTVVITNLGLFGLASFLVVRRTKEIGIRKVNGATVGNILVMLLNDFSKWIILAFVIACPIVYYIMNRWLQNFAYRIELRWWIFAISGLIVFAISTLTIVLKSWSAANLNPVDALRYE